MKKIQILSIDIGGSHIKATVLNQQGEQVQAYISLDTPNPASPEKVLKTIKELVLDLEDYDKIAVGFPGYVKDGVVKTAPNLSTELWKDCDLQSKLSEELGKPTRVVNDADLQGLGVVSREGFEIMVTLGTGFGTAFLKNGVLFPHIELAHHPVRKNTDYDQYIGDDALKKIGEEEWKKRVQEVIEILKTVFNYDRLYIGGGNSRLIDFEVDKNIKLVSNKDGIKGGAMLWKEI